MSSSLILAKSMESSLVTNPTYRIIKEVAIDELDGGQPWFEREVFPISVSFKIVNNQ